GLDETRNVDDASRLMARVQDRDVGSFEVIYDAHYRLVYGIAMRILGDSMAAEDVTQAVFLKVWSAPEAFRGGNFGAWIARVARNGALDVLRSRALRSEGEIPTDIPVEGMLEDVVFSNIEGTRVRAALADLPPDQREPIELGFFGGITHEEIARRMATPLGTIKTRIRTGLRRLRSSLETELAR
ncbi:MAG TPA: sigma-70 family RNA polymerase sigma factor, partial [Candidatus Baltobacteraceae bacterium]|nr:sigma-70 family RNA polymerase sigma factor [Candidatus Baltobacteraceae bacterium]